jgi:hypothetical protein
MSIKQCLLVRYRTLIVTGPVTRVYNRKIVGLVQ